jgi:hypothetical protein
MAERDQVVNIVGLAGGGRAFLDVGAWPVMKLSR